MLNLLAQEAGREWLSPAALGVYGTFLGVVLTVIGAPLLKQAISERNRRLEREEAARKKAEKEEAERVEAERRQAASDAAEAVETSRWLRGQVTKLQTALDGQARELTELRAALENRDRQIEKQDRKIAGLQDDGRQWVRDRRTLERRIAQLEGVLASIPGMSVPAPEPEYRELLTRDLPRRPEREKDE